MEDAKGSKERHERYMMEKEQKSVAAGKEQEAKSKQDQNEREEREEQVSLSVRRAMAKEREICTFELTTSNLKPPFSSVALGAPET